MEIVGQLFSAGKDRNKKTSQKLWNVLEKNWEGLGRFWEKSIPLNISVSTFYQVLQLPSCSHRTAFSRPPWVDIRATCLHPL